jgi:hypothetical protein
MAALPKDALPNRHETPVFFDALAAAGNTTPGIAEDNLHEIINAWDEHHIETFLELTASA